MCVPTIVCLRVSAPVQYSIVPAHDYVMLISVAFVFDERDTVRGVQTVLFL